MNTALGTADRCAHAFTDYLAGDHPRMADLVNDASPAMWHAARAIGLEASSAEDAVQYAWSALVSKANSIRDPQAVLGWLITTTRHEALKLARQRSRTAPDEGVTTGSHDAVPAQRTQAPIPTPEDTVLLSAQQLALWEAVQELTPTCQEILRTIAFADKPNYAALSQRLGMAVGSIGPTRGRCLNALRKSLSNDPNWRSA